MNPWLLHPKYLDQQGLVVLWRKVLPVQNLLSGKTSSYRHYPPAITHPRSLQRAWMYFRSYTHFIYKEKLNGKNIDNYNFDSLNEAVNASEKNSSSGRPRRLMKSLRAAFTITGAPQAYT